MPATTEVAPAARQLLWFVGLWAAGVAAVGSVAFLLRLVIRSL